MWPCVGVFFGTVHSRAKWPERPQLKQVWPEVAPAVGGAGRHITELREGLVGSPLQSVVEVVPWSRGKPSRHGPVGGVSRNVHMDLAAHQPELTVQTTTVRGKPRVAEAVQHVLEQGGKPGAVQPITTKPSIGSKGGVGVVIHLSKTREKRINISSIEQGQQTKTPSIENKGETNQHFIHRTEATNHNSKINHDDVKTLTPILFSAMTISQNSAD
jgi:hypothetical protein